MRRSAIITFLLVVDLQRINNSVTKEVSSDLSSRVLSSDKIKWVACLPGDEDGIITNECEQNSLVHWPIHYYTMSKQGHKSPASLKGEETEFLKSSLVGIGCQSRDSLDDPPLDSLHDLLIFLCPVGPGWHSELWCGLAYCLQRSMKV